MNEEITGQDSSGVEMIKPYKRERTKRLVLSGILGITLLGCLGVLLYLKAPVSTTPTPVLKPAGTPILPDAYDGENKGVVGVGNCYLEGINSTKVSGDNVNLFDNAALGLKRMGDSNDLPVMIPTDNVTYQIGDERYMVFGGFLLPQNKGKYKEYADTGLIPEIDVEKVKANDATFFSTVISAKGETSHVITGKVDCDYNGTKALDVADAASKMLLETIIEQTNELGNLRPRKITTPVKLKATPARGLIE